MNLGQQLKFRRFYQTSDLRCLFPHLSVYNYIEKVKVCRFCYSIYRIIDLMRSKSNNAKNIFLNNPSLIEDEIVKKQEQLPAEPETKYLRNNFSDHTWKRIKKFDPNVTGNTDHYDKKDIPFPTIPINLLNEYQKYKISQLKNNFFKRKESSNLLDTSNERKTPLNKGLTPSSKNGIPLAESQYIVATNSKKSPTSRTGSITMRSVNNEALNSPRKMTSFPLIENNSSQNFNKIQRSLSPEEISEVLDSTKDIAITKIDRVGKNFDIKYSKNDLSHASLRLHLGAKDFEDKSPSRGISLTNRTSLLYSKLNKTIKKLGKISGIHAKNRMPCPQDEQNDLAYCTYIGEGKVDDTRLKDYMSKRPPEKPASNRQISTYIDLHSYNVKTERSEQFNQNIKSNTIINRLHTNLSLQTSGGFQKTPINNNKPNTIAQNQERRKTKEFGNEYFQRLGHVKNVSSYTKPNLSKTERSESQPNIIKVQDQ